MSACKLCGDEIAWAVTRSGKFIPLEPESIDLQDGDLEIDDEGVPFYTPALGHDPHFNHCRRARPPPPPPPRPREPTTLELAYQRLQVIPGAHIEVARAAYRALTKLHHPDVGGDHETMLRINLAMEQVEAAR